MKVSDGVGGPLRTPITILNGASNGPRLWVVSGLHGDEYDACIAAARITRLIDPGKLSGALISIPVANVLAWESRSYETPEDHKDMLFAFPGDPRGSRTQQIANGIFSEMTSKCDFLIDLHNGNTVNLVANHSYNFGEGDVGKRSKELSMAFGFPIVVGVEEPFEGLLMCEAAATGIPSIVAECGGEGRVHDQMIADLIGGMSNVMRYLGMTDGTAVTSSADITFARWSPKPELEGHVRASRAGYVELKVTPGDSVSKGQTIAEITDVFGRSAEHLKAPHDSVVTELRTWATVNPGDIVAFLPVLE